jgi:hypothetical protein
MEYFVHLGAHSVDAIKQACGTEVEELNVTENGTYNAPSGKAYNPVTVNVESSGGDSDFSTAEVTIIKEADSDYNIEITLPLIEDGYLTGVYSYGPNIPESVTVTVALLNGKCVIFARSALDYGISGSIAYDADLGGFVITGDCTITIAGA